MNIDFITFIGPNSSDYAEYLKYTCEIFKSGKHNINYKCIESVGAERWPEGFDCVAKSGDVGHNSMNHGVAMNLATKYIESDYVVFIDCDMAIVYPNWDDIIINELNSVDCFGVSYGEEIKYKNFPTVYLFSFRKHILDKCNLDFTPDITQGSEKPLRKRLNENEAKLYQEKQGTIIKCDTGWKLPMIIRKAGFKSKSLPMISMTSKKSQLPFEDAAHKKLCLQKSNHHSEWHYNGKLFTTHKQASRTQPLNETWGKAWKKRIDLYIKRTN